MTTKQQNSKLRLRRESLRELTARDLATVAAGCGSNTQGCPSVR